jgi:nitroreductase
MDFKQVLENRKSIRKYIPAEISDDVVLDILQAGHLAPSAKNRQPWRFKILKGVDKDVIADKMILMKAAPDDPIEIEKFGFTTSYSGAIVKEASVLILVYKTAEARWGMPDTISIGAAIQNCMLSAVDQGFATLWIGDIFYMREELNIQGMDLVSAFIIGQPANINYTRQRKDIKDVILK